MNGKSLYKWLAVGMLLLLLCLAGGCAARQQPDADMTPPPQESGEQGETGVSMEPDIQPTEEEEMVQQRVVTLYYRMQGEDLLAAETRLVYFPSDRQTERVLAETLMSGPSPRLLELTGLFPSGTKVYSSWRTGNLLTVILSREFLSTPSGVPLDWEGDSYWRSEVYMRRQLALTSIVNTITEATDYTSVQFLVQENDSDPTGRRLFMSELYDGAPSDQLLAPMLRNEHLILTHANTADVLLESWKEQTFDRMYRFIAQDTTQRPTDSAFQEEMRQRNMPLIHYSISAGTVSNDGQSAVMEATFEYRTELGTVQVQNFPLHLIREDGVWKITYSELKRMMEAT